MYKYLNLYQPFFNEIVIILKQNEYNIIKITFVMLTNIIIFYDAMQLKTFTLIPYFTVSPKEY